MEKRKIPLPLYGAIATKEMFFAAQPQILNPDVVDQRFWLIAAAERAARRRAGKAALMDIISRLSLAAGGWLGGAPRFGGDRDSGL